MRVLVMVGSLLLVLAVLSMVLNLLFLNWTGLVVTFAGVMTVVVTGIWWYRVTALPHKR